MSEPNATHPHIRIIGAGLAGCEAAWQAAKCGVSVSLYEMKPRRRTPAHHADGYAELVCSNSLRSDEIYNAVGLLKQELRVLDSLIMEAAEQTRVPAGSALAVDREKFSAYITEKIKSHPLITVYEGEEITSLEDEDITVVATGPLTSEALSAEIFRILGDKSLYFYDAAAPIVDAQSIDYSVAFFASRYGKGDSQDYLNCPMTKEQYDAFYQALITAEVAKMHEFEKDLTVFEGCMPVEVMAKRGVETLLFGPMKPVGLPLPDTGKDAYAIVQLRRENKEGSMYNLVGFQTHLTFLEQRRVFRMIPGLENAEFLRYGVMHRNTYIHSPGILSSTYAMIERPRLFFAGQMTGVEGYVESASSGLVAGINAARLAKGLAPFVFSAECMIGALANHVGNGNAANFQPMNANFGIVAPLAVRVKGGKKARNDAYAARGVALVSEYKKTLYLD